MGVRRRGPSASIIFSLTVASFMGSSFAAPDAKPSKLPEAYQLAYRFASSIASDPKDRSAAQQLVVEDVAARGAFDDALRMTDGIEGWRQGAAWAALASSLAKAGQTERARETLARARGVRATTTGWQIQRLDALLAEAEAALGNAEAATKLARQVSEIDPRQYAGRSAATEAKGAISKNDFPAAMTTLENLDSEKDAEIARWRTTGYLDLASAASLSREQQLKAFDAAIRSSETLFGWQRAESLEGLAKRAAALDAVPAVRAAAERAEKDLAPAEERGSPAALAGLARTWALLGDAERGRKLLTKAEGWVPYELDIDRPGVYAYLAGGWVATGDSASAARLYDLAFGSAEKLLNSRPRALAGVEICRSLGQSGLPLTDSSRAELNRLLKSVTDVTKN